MEIKNKSDKTCYALKSIDCPQIIFDYYALVEYWIVIKAVPISSPLWTTLPIYVIFPCEQIITNLISILMTQGLEPKQPK